MLDLVSTKRQHIHSTDRNTTGMKQIAQLVITLVAVNLHVPSAAAVCPNGSPIAICGCTTNNKGGIVIDCRDKGLTAIPPITATDRVFDELIFNVIQQIPSISNNITSIPDDAFANLKVKKIDFTGNPIRQVSNGAFRGLETLLEELILDGPKSLPYVAPPMEVLWNLTNLKTLELEFFYLLTVPAPTLFKFPNLLNLKLKSMHINFISPDSFTDIRNLEKLEIIGNENLKTFPTAAIGKLTKLKHLSFKQNGLEKLYRQSLMNQTNLEELDFSNNKINELEDRCFEGLYNKLAALLLQFNKLSASNLTPLKSYSWSQLHQLNLGYNPLAQIPDNMFINMPNMAYINLMQSSITSIRRYDFKGLKNANHIDISFNTITSIADGAFSECPNLKQLDMEQFNDGDSTNILRLTTATFHGIESSLEKLNMENTRVVENSFWEEFKTLTSLTEARLSKTGLTTIPECVFKDLTSLNFLKLQENNIANLNQKMLNGLENSLGTLDMQINNIQSLDECVFKEFNNLLQFNLDQNPLKCDCQLKGYREWILAPHPGVYFNWNIKCQNLQNKQLKDVAVSDLVCDSNFVAPVCLQPNAMCLPPTTTMQPQTTTEAPTTTPEPQIPLPKLNLGIVSESVNSFQISWQISDVTHITGYSLTHEKLGVMNSKVTSPVDKTKNDINIEGLDSGSQYEICLSYTMMDGRTGPPLGACKVARTKEDTNTPVGPEPSTGANVGAIVGGLVGGLVPLFVVAFAIVFVLRKKKAKKDKPLPPVHFTSYTPSSMPRTPDNARRWVKTKNETNGDIQINAISSGKMQPEDKSRISAGSYQSLQGNGAVNLNPIPANHKLGGATGTGRNYLTPSNHKYINTQSRDSEPPRYVNDPRLHPRNINGAYSNDVDTRPLPKAPIDDTEKLGHTNKGFNNKEEPSPKSPSQNIYHEIPL